MQLRARIRALSCISPPFLPDCPEVNAGSWIQIRLHPTRLSKRKMIVLSNNNMIQDLDIH